jgi:hypothetical protein
MAPRFLTVADELLEYAEAAVAYFEGLAYRVKPELMELGYPQRPTMVCKRNGTTVFVEVDSKISLPKVEHWRGYCSSRNTDSQVAICIPTGAPLNDLLKLQELGIGLYECTPTGVVERLQPRDLALPLQLPNPTTLAPKVRRVWGPVAQQHGRGNWREAFDDACKIFESESRKYLKKGLQTGRVIVLDESGRPRTLTNIQIDRMTLGNLAKTFAKIQAPNKADQIIGQALAMINPLRVASTHHRQKQRTETALRSKVGAAMYAIIMALRELLA